MRVVYSVDAEADLDGVALYTLLEWSLGQAVLYMAQLREACEALPDARRFGRPVPDDPGMLRIRCEKHLIYFRVDGEVLEVVRILHERQLPSRHL